MKNQKQIINSMKLELAAESINESFARTTVAAFAAQLDPTLDEIADLKTAISEAVTNSIVHAYGKGHSDGKPILLDCQLWTIGDKERGISIKITDFGIGIQNIERALEPFYTTKPNEERSGMGFTVMQSFMDSLRVVNGQKGGTVVEMTKVFGQSAG